jgi:hypothetical protein
MVYRFQAALKKYGVPEEEIFQTADLFERRNIPQVTLCLYALARLVSTQCSPMRLLFYGGTERCWPSGWPVKTLTNGYVTNRNTRKPTID